MQYEIYEWRFKDKKSRIKFLIYARTEQTALKLIEIENYLNVVYFKPQRFKFKVACSTTRPPYEIECEQETELERRKQHRLDYYKKHGGIEKWKQKIEKHY